MSARRDAGAALAIGLLLLPIATVFGVGAIVTATVELRMAGNLQYRERAFEAAEFAIEQAIASVDLSTAYTLDAPKLVPAASGTTIVMPGAPADGYAYRLYYDPTDGSGTPEDVADAGLQAFHFVVEAEGRSARGAHDLHVQGFYVVRATGWSSGPAIPCAVDATGCSALAGSVPQRTYWRQQDAD
jgi:hypothetical protein